MDLAILMFIQEHLRGEVTDQIFLFLTAIGESGFVWIALTVLLLLSKKHRKCGIMLAVGLAVTFLLGEFVIKNIVQRPRPFVDYPDITLLITPPWGFSFPSSHASSSFAAATMLWFYNHRWGAFAYVLAFGIAFSRLYMFVHYPSDAFFGALLGILLSAILYAVFFRPKGPEKVNRRIIRMR